VLQPFRGIQTLLIYIVKIFRILHLVLSISARKLSGSYYKQRNLRMSGKRGSSLDFRALKRRESHLLKFNYVQRQFAIHIFPKQLLTLFALSELPKAV